MTKKLIKELTDLREVRPSKVLRALKKVMKKESFTDFNIEKITSKSYPLLHAVNRGGESKGFVVTLNASKIKEARAIVIGKGVTYDSGGYHMKPHPHMKDMFHDKGGAMLAFVNAIKHKTPTVIFLINNMVGPKSLVNGEILKSVLGESIVVDHTDAEGRLGLADLLEHVSEINQRAHVITVATLTGAAAAYVGKSRVGILHTHNLDLRIAAVTHNHNLGLKMFPSFTDEVFDGGIKSKLSKVDITNSGSGPGSQQAYSFLKRFYGSSLLHHFDIAGMTTDENGNPTGLGLKELKFLVDFVERLH